MHVSILMGPEACARIRLLVPGFGFRVSSLGFRFGVVGFRVSGFGFRVGFAGPQSGPVTPSLERCLGVDGRGGLLPGLCEL